MANASHELRTPLAGQRTLLEVALADPEASAADLRAACEEALALEEHQERLIGALLTLASSEGGVERRESVDLAALAGRVVMMGTDEAHRRGVRLQVSPGAAWAAGDPDLLESLLANLVANGLRHNVDGGSLQAVTETRAGQAVVSVTNTGPAVSAEDVDRLFEPFRRAGNDRTRTGDGHGLGLSIVRAVADAHGATLTVEPQTGGGLRVEVVFPFQAWRPGRRKAPARAYRFTSQAASGAPPSVAAAARRRGVRDLDEAGRAMQDQPRPPREDSGRERHAAPCAGIRSRSTRYVKGWTTTGSQPCEPRDDRAGCLELVDRKGLEALSMRNVAATLGIGTMTLYGHVRTRDEIVSGIVELLLGEVDTRVRAEKRWVDILRRVAASGARWLCAIRRRLHWLPRRP